MRSVRSHRTAPRLSQGEVGGYRPPAPVEKPLSIETPKPKRPPVIILGRSQLRAHAAVMAGDNILITGPGGTGKSELLGRIITDLRADRRSPAVTASTGVAALRIGGGTVHSFLGTNICSSIGELQRAYKRDEIHLGGDRFQRMLRTKVLIVDEVSMLSGDYIDMMDYHLRDTTCIDEPFGGKQVIFCGDFLQLPPVIKDLRGVKSQFAFQSDAWKGADVRRMALTENFRQTDMAFRKHLDAIRFGELPQNTVEFFQGAVRRELPVEEPMRLYPLNRRVDALNAKKLAELTTETRRYKAQFAGISKLWRPLEKNAPVRGCIVMKTGARVMLCRNDYQAGYRNGQRGVLMEHTSPGDWRESLYVMMDDGYDVRVDPFSFEWKNDRGDVLAEMLQYPLRLAWAVSIHKSQGATLDNVVCDLRGVFEAGQVYVALSRVRRAEGLSLASAILRKQVFANRACVDYYPRIRRKR